jgi:transposase
VRKLFADGAYAGQLLAWVKALIPRRGLKIEIVKRINAGFKILPERWVVERTYAWLARYRRLAKDYERKTKDSEATTYIASCKSCSPSL